LRFQADLRIDTFRFPEKCAKESVFE